MNTWGRSLGAAATLAVACVLAACSREQAASAPKQAAQPPQAAPAQQATALVIVSGTKVNIGDRIAEVHGHDDHLCGGPIEFKECKVVKVEPGNHPVTLVAKDAQGQFVQWDEVWQVSKVEMPNNGSRLKITRPNGTVVRSTR